MKSFVISIIIVCFTILSPVVAQEQTTIVPDHFKKMSPGNKAIGQSYMPMFCSTQQPFLTELEERFGESMVFMSQARNAFGEVLYHQLWMNPESETWSFLILNVQRDSLCILASGQGFVDLKNMGMAL